MKLIQNKINEIKKEREEEMKDIIECIVDENDNLIPVGNLKAKPDNLLDLLRMKKINLDKTIETVKNLDNQIRIISDEMETTDDLEHLNTLQIIKYGMIKRKRQIFETEIGEINDGE